MEHLWAQADGAGVRRIEAIHKQITTLEEDHGEREPRAGRGLDHVSPLDAEQVAKEDVVEVNVGPGEGKKDQAECEEPREDDAHDGVFFHAAVRLDPSGGE